MSDLNEMVEIDDETPFILHPGEFVLASALEYIALSEDLVARLEGKNSLGHIGLLIHSFLSRMCGPRLEGQFEVLVANA